MTMFARIAVAALLAICSMLPMPALAQPVQPINTTASWLPQSKGAAISVTTSSAASLLPVISGSTLPGQTAWLCNTGSNDAYLTFGTANTMVSTVAGGTWLKAGTCGAYILTPRPGLSYTYVATIGSGGSTSISVETGLGNPPLNSLGGGSSGGGNVVITGPLGTQTIAASVAVTQSDGADVSLGAIADAASTAGGAGTVNAHMRFLTSVAFATSTNQTLQITQETAFNTNIGAPGSSACATDTGSCNGNALLQRLAQRLSTINTTLGSPYQAGGALPLPAGASTSAAQTTGNNSLSSIDGKTPALGQAASAASVPVVLPTDPDVRPNSANVTVVDSGSTSTPGFNSINLITGSPTAGSSASNAINGMSSVSVTVTGTWTGTLSFEISADGGTTWVASTMRQRGGSYRTGTTTGNGVFDADVSGKTNFRVRATAAMTGTAVVKPAFSATNGPVQVQNPVQSYDTTSNAQATIKPANTAPLASDTSQVVALNPNSPGVVATGTAAVPNTTQVYSFVRLPTGTPITASSGNVANASAVATLAAVSNKTTYITGFQCTASGATVGLDVTVTVSGTVTGTMSYSFSAAVGALVASTPLIVTFGEPVPASTTNTTIVVTLPALGTGNTNSTCSAQGFQL